MLQVNVKNVCNNYVVAVFCVFLFIIKWMLSAFLLLVLNKAILLNMSLSGIGGEHLPTISINIGTRCITYINTTKAWKQLLKSVKPSNVSYTDDVDLDKPKRTGGTTNFTNLAKITLIHKIIILNNIKNIIFWHPSNTNCILSWTGWMIRFVTQYNLFWCQFLKNMIAVQSFIDIITWVGAISQSALSNSVGFIPESHWN